MILVLTTLMMFPVATALPVSIIASPGFSEAEFSPVVASTPDSLSTTASFVLSTVMFSWGGVSVFSVVVVALSAAPSSISVSSPVGGADSPFSGGGEVSPPFSGGAVVSVTFVFTTFVVSAEAAASPVSITAGGGSSAGGGVSALSAGGGVVSVVAGGGVVSSPSASTKSVGAVLKETLNARSNAKRPFPNLCCKEFEYICNECF